MSPLINEVFLLVEVVDLSRFEPLRIVQDEKIVLGRINFFLDVTFSGFRVRSLTVALNEIEYRSSIGASRRRELSTLRLSILNVSLMSVVFPTPVCMIAFS